MTEDKLIEFSDGENILFGSWAIPSSQEAFPIVILATGDGPNGSMGMTWENLRKKLLEKGIATFLFDFSGLGHSPGIYQELTLTLGCRNFRGVMDYLNSSDYDISRLGVIGSSYGGNVALLEASNYPEIKALGFKSTSAFLPEGYELQYGSEFMEKWGSAGYLKEVGLNYTAVVDSLFHNTFEAASRINAPVRLVHGTADTAVPIRHARDLLRVLPNGSLYEVKGADHWYAEGDEWERMAVNLVEFMEEIL